VLNRDRMVGDVVIAVTKIASASGDVASNVRS
jgi:hypothetical protein